MMLTFDKFLRMAAPLFKRMLRSAQRRERECERKRKIWEKMAVPGTKIRIRLPTLAILFVLLIPSFAHAQSVPQAPDLLTTTLSASSGNVAAATATATLAPGPAPTGQMVFICGFAATAGGATAAAIVPLTVTGVQGGTMTFAFGSDTATPAVTSKPLIVTFPACIQASNSGISIVVSMPTLGAGNTNASVNAWGYRR